MSKQSKLNELLKMAHIKGTLRFSNEQMLTESKKVKSLEDRLVQYIYIENKSIGIAKAVVDELIFYELEKVDNDYLLARNMWSARSSRYPGYWMIARTPLTNKEVASLDQNNLEKSLLELALDIDHKQWRFGA